MTTVNLSLSNSTFTYDGRDVNNIEIQMRGRGNQERGDSRVDSEVARGGSASRWRHGRLASASLRDERHFECRSHQLSDTLQPGTALRGAGNFSGTVKGEGDRFTLKGEIKSDALAADNLRLQGLNISANGSAGQDLRD